MGQIRCDFCGAVYDDSEKVCPYCGSENTELSIREQEDFLSDLKERRRRLNDEIPQERISKATGKVRRLAVILLVLFIILIFSAALFSIVSVRLKLKKQQEALSILEGYYESNDYAAMNEYYNAHYDLYSATYDKYYYLGQAYNWYDVGSKYLEDDLWSYNTFGGTYENLRDNVSNDLSYLFRAMSILKGLEDNGYVYNEKKGVEYIRGLILPVLHDTCRLTDEEIESATAAYEGYETEYTEVAEIMLGRMD